VTVKLKLYHKSADKVDEITALNKQQAILLDEIDQFIIAAVNGQIPPDRIVAPQCKVYKQEGNEINVQNSQSLAALINGLVEANYKMYVNQDKLYNFSNVPSNEKDQIVNKCCVLNLERNKFMDQIDKRLLEMLQ
jgi:hypothetical protein